MWVVSELTWGAIGCIVLIGQSSDFLCAPYVLAPIMMADMATSEHYLFLSVPPGDTDTVSSSLSSLCKYFTRFKWEHV